MNSSNKLDVERIRMSQEGHGFLNTDYLDSLRSRFDFELRSLIGRFFFPILHKNISTKKYLNLGCGKTRLENYTNLDFYNKTLFSRHPDPEVMHDLRYPLPFPDNHFDGVFSEHTLEHLYPNEAFNLLREMHRIISKGGVVRISLPDLGKEIERYNENNYPSDQAKTRGERFNSVFRWGHRAVYDAEFLSYLLELVGFVNVQEREFCEGVNEELCIELEERKRASFYVEGIKGDSRL